MHLDLDLRTGEYSIANAGHPSPARYTNGRARWTVLDGGRGPLLGVVPDAELPRQTGRLDRGDALLLYSDGVIESRGRDLTDGIDRMLGVASVSVLGTATSRGTCASRRVRGRMTTGRRSPSAVSDAGEAPAPREGLDRGIRPGARPHPPRGRADLHAALAQQPADRRADGDALSPPARCPRGRSCPWRRSAGSGRSCSRSARPRRGGHRLLRVAHPEADLVASRCTCPGWPGCWPPRTRPG